MAFYTTMNHVHESRTLKPRYARTQATPQAWTLDPEWDAAQADIFPGSVMARKGDGTATLATSDEVAFGLCGNYIAPVYGIDEVRGDGNWDIAIWVLGNDSIMAVSAPAFDLEADWAGAKADLATKKVYLGPNAKGLLTISEDGPFELVDVESADTILVCGR